MAEATAVVQQADRALHVARALAEGATGQLRLSYARMLFSDLPELIVSEYQQRFPGVEMTTESGTTVRTLSACQPASWMSPSS